MPGGKGQPASGQTASGTESPPAAGEMPADDHASHHPEASAKGAAPKAAPAPGASGSGMSGMGGTSSAGGMGGMGQMMERMHSPPQKALYPSLMELPDLPPEQHARVLRQARERIAAGRQQLTDAARQLAQVEPGGDPAAVGAAAIRAREGLAQLESGLAAYRAVAAGGDSRAVARDWFRRQMHLLPPTAPEADRAPGGLMAFHVIALLILAGFAAAMLWLYFQRMRRASLLLANLAAGGAGAMSPTAPGPVRPAGSLAPSAGPWSGPLRVARIFEETADVKTFRLALPEGGELLPFTFDPGQFLTVSVNVDGKEARRSYSIASSPCCQGWCEITVKHAPTGLVSSYLHERVREGDLLTLSGPYGRFTFRGKEAPNVVFIAGGVGITPLMSSIRYLTDQSWPGEIFLIYACARLEDVIFRDELEYLRHRHPNFHLTITLSREESPAWTGPRGYVTRELLQSAVPDLTGRRMHLCGPPPMMDAVKGLLAELGVPAEQVKTELFVSAEPRRISAPGVETPIAAPRAAVQAALCTFARSKKTAALPPDQSVLEASEEVGVDIPYSCREGYCGVCKIRLLAGQVTMAVEDGLTPAEKAGSLILACQAKSTGDVTVDA
jgi:glycine betaine catabolism B